MKYWWSVLSVALPSKRAAIKWRKRFVADRLPGNEVPWQKTRLAQDIYGTWRVLRKWYDGEIERDELMGSRKRRDQFRQHLDASDRHARKIIKGLK